MKKFRLLSGFMAFLMVLGSFVVLPVYAATMGPTVNEDGEVVAPYDYMETVFRTPEDKLEKMQLMVTSEDGRYSLYADVYSGEVAYRDNLLGQTQFTNPYNLNAVSPLSSRDIKSKLMSQIIIRYLDNDKELYYYSFNEAAERGQIKIKNIKNGIRVEYSIGREETRKLVPKMIEKTRFEEQIRDNMTDSGYAMGMLTAYYALKDPSDPELTDTAVKDMLSAYPITKEMPVYVFDSAASAREMNEIEELILNYCPLYTFDELDKDHELVQYEGTDAAPAQFKMALEYYLDNGTLKVRFPVNGLRFDDTAFQLTSIQILPYFGSGSYSNKGYMFTPDGSGAIIRFEDFAGLSGKSVTGKVYGQDFAFYTITGQHQESVRMPMFGLVENEEKYVQEIVETPVDPYYDAFGNYIENEVIRETVNTLVNEEKGFFAIVEEGESLATITTETGGKQHNFDSIYTSITPRQRDTYNISETVSGAASAMWTVTSKRKYTDNYTIRITMLNSGVFAEKKGLTEDDYYEASYMGMVNIARDYMEERGLITRLREDDVQKDIPLYIETFGTVPTTEKILSFPIEVQTPLTTFEDMKEMTTRLNEKGITNINYKLTGFFNGGLAYSVPYEAEVEKNAGGEEGFKDFIAYAKEKDLGVYPDFDFVWADIRENDMFSGLNRRKHLIKAMNSKYVSLRVYTPLYQQYAKTTYLAVSPVYYEHFYESFAKDYTKLDPIGISVSSLGQYLNSDFDKKEPFHREDNKGYTAELFQQLKADYGNVMTEGGNYYTLPYITDILNMPIDSSSFINTSQTIPFMGMVLHGYKNFTGMAMNNAGDMDYQILKAIENGAGVYFQLSYRNTEKLKTNGNFSKYYSINFDIWENDVVEVYSTLNEVLADLQTKLIVDHEFITAQRVLTADELAELEAELAALEAARLEAEAAEKEAAEAEGELKGEESAEDTTKKEEPVEEEETEEVDLLAERTLVDNGKVVKVTYEGGTTFILNYNNFAITVDGEEIPALGFVRKN